MRTEKKKKKRNKSKNAKRGSTKKKKMSQDGNENKTKEVDGGNRAPVTQNKDTYPTERAEKQSNNVPLEQDEVSGQKNPALIPIHRSVDQSNAKLAEKRRKEEEKQAAGLLDDDEPVELPKPRPVHSEDDADEPPTVAQGGRKEGPKKGCKQDQDENGNTKGCSEASSRRIASAQHRFAQTQHEGAER